MLEKRTAIVARQNETIRRYAGESVDLATLDLSKCIAIVITNSKGDTSLTHVDAATDLSFIKEELKLMGEGSQVHIIRGLQDSTVGEKLFRGKNQSYIPEGIKVDFSKATTGAILIGVDNKITFPLKVHLQFLAKERTFTESEESQLESIRNSTAYLSGKHRYPEPQNLITDFGPEFQLRDRIAEIGTALSPFRSRAVVYDKGYLINESNIGFPIEISEKVNSLRSQYEKSIAPAKMTTVSLDAFMHRTFMSGNLVNPFLKEAIQSSDPSAKALLKRLEHSLLSYWDYQDRQKSYMLTNPSNERKAVPIVPPSNARLYVPNPIVEGLKKETENVLKAIFPRNWIVDLDKKRAMLVLEKEQANDLVDHLSGSSLTAKVDRIKENNAFVIISDLNLENLKKTPPFLPAEQKSSFITGPAL